MFIFYHSYKQGFDITPSNGRLTPTLPTLVQLQKEWTGAVYNASFNLALRSLAVRYQRPVELSKEMLADHMVLMNFILQHHCSFLDDINAQENSSVAAVEEEEFSDDDQVAYSPTPLSAPCTSTSLAEQGHHLW